MEIYIEIFLIQNILINFCILRLIELTTKQKTSFFKLFFASLIGSVFSVFYIYLLNNVLLRNLTKLICGIILILLAFKQSFKQFIFNFILLYLYTFALGGAITHLSSNIYITNVGIVSQSYLSLEIICLATILITYIFQLVTKHLKFNFKQNKLIYKLKLYKNNNSISVNAYLDTGNLLNLNGKPIIILDINSYLKLSKTTLINFLLTNTNEIKTNTVTGVKNLKIFKIDKIELFTKNKKTILTEQLIAVNTNSFKNTNYQALLSPLLF